MLSSVPYPWRNNSKQIIVTCKGMLDPLEVRVWEGLVGVANGGNIVDVMLD